MKAHIQPFLNRNKQLVLAGLFLVLSLFSAVDNLVNFAGRGYIHEKANSFLDESEVSAGETFLLVSTAKAGLSIIESSQGGITFVIEAKVQLGKAFEVLQELVDRSWEVSFLSLSLLFATKLILNGVNAFADTIFVILAATGFAHAICRRYWIPYSNITGNLFRSLATSTFVLLIGLPLAIFLTSLIADSITGKYKDQAKGAFTDHNSLFQHNSGNEGLKESSHAAINAYKNNKKSVNEHVKNLHSHVYRHMAVVALETIVFPLLILGILYLAINRILKRPSSLADAEARLKTILDSVGAGNKRLEAAIEPVVKSFRAKGEDQQQGQS